MISTQWRRNDQKGLQFHREYRCFSHVADLSEKVRKVRKMRNDQNSINVPLDFIQYSAHHRFDCFVLQNNHFAGKSDFRTFVTFFKTHTTFGKSTKISTKPTLIHAKTQHQFFGIMKHEESDTDIGSGFIMVEYIIS